MALITIGAYAFPEPSKDGYKSTRTPIMRVQDNAKGVRIGEFVKYRYSFRAVYNRLLGTDYHAMIAAAEGTGSTFLTGVAVTFLDQDSGTYLTKTMLLEIPEAQLFKISPEEYANVVIEMTEQ